MPNFLRIAQVTVGAPGQDGQKITDNRVSFRVVKTSKQQPNNCSISLWNLAPKTRVAFEITSNVVVLSCGYLRGQIAQTFIGNITRGFTEYSHPDIVTNAECGDGVMAIRESRVMLSYDGAVTASQVIGDIAAKMGLMQRPTSADTSGKYLRGFAFAGPARKALTQVTDRFGLTWSVQNDQLQITTRRMPASDEVQLINPDTGLLRITLNHETLDENLVGDKAPPGLIVFSLLNPVIEPGGIVAIESRDYKRSQYRVDSVEHTGDTRGADWHTKLIVTEL